MSGDNTNLLLDFLSAGLLPVGDNDEHVARLERASASLAEELTREPEKAIAAVLVGLDAEADPDEPAFVLAEEHVRREWRALRNAHVDRPRTLLRAVMLEACRRASGSPRMAALVLNTALSPVQAGLTQLGREQEAISRFLLALSQQVERSVVAQAGGAAAAPLPSTSAPSSPSTSQPPRQIAADDVLLQVVAAAGPSGRNGEGLTSPTPHWPNSGQPWSYEFAPRMTDALVHAVNLGIERTLQGIQEQAELDRAWLTQHLTSHASYLNALSKALQAQQAGHQLRLDVLWWQEALYSPTLLQGYRSLPAITAAVAMAHDLHRLAPPLAPASLAYVLAEATARLPGAAHGERAHLLDLLPSLARTSLLRTLVASPSRAEGRAPVLHLIETAVHGSVPGQEALLTHTGFPLDAAVDLPTLAMWCFRDLQARRLARGQP